MKPIVTSPYERRKTFFTPERVSSMEKDNREARYKKYPILKEMDALLEALNREAEGAKVVSIRRKAK